MLATAAILGGADLNSLLRLSRCCVPRATAPCPIYRPSDTGQFVRTRAPCSGLTGKLRRVSPHEQTIFRAAEWGGKLCARHSNSCYFHKPLSEFFSAPSLLATAARSCALIGQN